MGDNDFATGYALGQNDGGGRNNNGWGDGASWIWIILIFCLWGWGGNGNGWGNNGSNNGGGGAVPYLGGIATRADISEGFALNGIQSGIQGIQQGLCDSTYALNNSITNGFHGTDMQLCNGFSGVQQSFNQLGYELQNCCCQTQRAIDNTNFNMSKGFCDIIQNTHNDTDRVIAQLNQMESNRQQEKIQALQTENQTLRFQASQTAQNGYIDAVGNSIIATLRQPSPIPAYTVPAPYPYAGNCGNSCGCNCGCGC